MTDLPEAQLIDVESVQAKLRARGLMGEDQQLTEMQRLAQQTPEAYAGTKPPRKRRSDYNTTRPKKQVEPQPATEAKEGEIIARIEMTKSNAISLMVAFVRSGDFNLAQQMLDQLKKA